MHSVEHIRYFACLCVPEKDFEYYVSEFTRSGFRGGVNYYRNLDANHFATTSERLPESVFSSSSGSCVSSDSDSDSDSGNSDSVVKVRQPCLFIAGEHDVSVLWNDGGMVAVADDVKSRCDNLAGAFFVKVVK